MIVNGKANRESLKVLTYDNPVPILSRNVLEGATSRVYGLKTTMKPIRVR